MKRQKKIWKQEEIEFLTNNHQNMTCSHIAKELGRSTRSVQHKYNELGLKKRKAEIGEIVNGWKIVDIYNKWNGQQNVTFAKIESTEDDKIKHVRLSTLTMKQIGHPIRRRPDLVERNTTHGMSHTRLFRIWHGMKNRCLYEKHLSYKHYGARGIKICDEWLDFDNFQKWANTNEYSEDLTLDRIDTDGDYCPENCRWATKVEQILNKRNTEKLPITIFGETKDAIEWRHDQRCNPDISITCLRYRIKSGWNPEDAISVPPERKGKLNCENWLKRNYPDIYEEYTKQ